MAYRRPEKLVIAIGSSEGYKDSARFIGKVSPFILERGDGSIYIASHLEPDCFESFTFWMMGISLKKTRIGEGTKLEAGRIYSQFPLYQSPSGKHDILIIGENGDNELVFRKSGPHKKLMGLGYSIENAMDVFGGDMMILGMSGNGNDGSTALKHIKNTNGNPPRILIRDPATSFYPSIPKKMMREAERLGLPYRKLAPEDIGLEINEFLKI